MTRILATEAASIYPFPTVVFGLIAFAVFILLGLVTWSFRDVANRHDHKDTKDNKGHN